MATGQGTLEVNPTIGFVLFCLFSSHPDRELPTFLQTAVSTPPNGEHVRKMWVTNPDHHNSAAVRHVDGTFSQQSLLANDSVSPG